MSSQADGLRRFVVERGLGDGWTPSDARVVLVAAGKGGIGTSTVAALLALAFAEQGRRTLLIDGDDQAGTLHHWFGVEPRIGIGALRGTGLDPREAVIHASEMLHLLPGGGLNDGAVPMLSTSERRLVWRRVAGVYADHDFVVIDGGCRLDTIMAASTAGVRRLAAVSAADPVALAATYALLKAVDSRIPGLPVDFVANGQDEARARALYDHVQMATQRWLHRGLNYGGTIPEDVPMRDGLAAGGTFASIAPDSPAASAAATLGGRLIAELDDVARRSIAPTAYAWRR
jgi:flagellar biosynthesis protein FlhG